MDSRAPRRASVIDLVPYGVVVADRDGAAISANRAWTRLTGQTDPVWGGHGWLDVCDAVGKAKDALLADVCAGRVHDADWLMTDRENQRRTLHVRAVPDLDHGRVVRFVVVAADVTVDRARSARLLDRATHDSLTGLFNRAQFLDFVEHALHRGRRAPERLAAVLFIDVDDLKAVNDASGHGAGDRVLREVAAPPGLGAACRRHRPLRRRRVRRALRGSRRGGRSRGDRRPHQRLGQR